MQYLIDTDWVIKCFRGDVDKLRRIRELTAEGVAISIMSRAELYEGIYRADDPVQHEASLTAIIGNFTILPVDDDTARIYGQHRGQLRAAGEFGTPCPHCGRRGAHQIGDMDLLIGATAIRHNLTLLTDNRRDFEQIPGLNIIPEQPDPND